MSAQTPPSLPSFPLLVIFLSAILLALFTTSLLVGPASVGLADFWSPGDDKIAMARHIILTEIRFPRSLLAVLVGASLGLSGAAMQGFLHNPLAEPGILGVSGGGALGAVLALYSGLSAHFSLALPIAAIIGALTSAFLLYMLAGRASRLSLILAGVALSSLSGALIALALNFSPNPFAIYEITFWLMGSLANRSMDHLWLVLPFMLTGWVMLLTTGRALAALSLGENVAASMGVPLARVQFFIVFGTALAVGASVAVSGIIGFVGLVVPHLMRPLVRFDPAKLLVVAGLAGANLLLLADMAVRLAGFDNELKLGVLTALVGAPFFLWLILTLRGVQSG